jgi:hypothetical protein
MFGLMSFTTCHKTEEQLYERRMLYCGTCKAIGSEYGQSARMVLNNDVVFLAELLQSLSRDGEKLENWASPFQSYNCFSLPVEAEIPQTLKIAAAVSMILTELKLDDHIVDSGSIAFKSAKALFNPTFQKSETEFAQMQFPMDDIRDWFNQQVIRERDSASIDVPQDRLNYLAEPTAMITALVFERSGAIIGGAGAGELMGKLGFSFGQLIYVLDAIEDVRRDFRSRSFNAIAFAYGMKTAFVPDQIYADLERQISETLLMLDTILWKLPLTSTQKQDYSARLWYNVRRKTGFVLEKANVSRELKTIASDETTLALNEFSTSACTHAGPRADHSASCSKESKGFKTQWNAACEKASSLTARIDQNCATPALNVLSTTQRSFVYVFVLLVALLSPMQTRSMRSYRDCIELPFNLIFWGAAIGTIVNSFIQFGNNGFQHAFAMVGGDSGGTDPRKGNDKRREFIGNHHEQRLNEREEREMAASDSEDSQSDVPVQRGINSQDRYKRSREYGPKPAPCWGPCCCEGSCEACGDCCASADSCTECCILDHLCGDGTCCAGSTDCCASADCCAGGADCCGSGGADCCASADCCSAGGDCLGGCSSC